MVWIIFIHGRGICINHKLYKKIFPFSFEKIFFVTYCYIKLEYAIKVVGFNEDPPLAGLRALGKNVFLGVKDKEKLLNLSEVLVNNAYLFRESVYI